MALSAIALAAIGVPLALSVAVFALSTGYVELNTAQIVPFALLALVLCGLALERGRDRLAGVLAALTLIEPIVGLPVVVATFLFAPRARWSSCRRGLRVCSHSACAIAGPKGFLEYLIAVLPAHSRSELLFPFQYSLTSALATLGISPALARVAGISSYVLLLAAALVIAPRASAQLRRRALIVFVPALCCVIGGTFLHQEELCFAIPAVTLLAWETTGRQRAIATVALCLLAVPWIAVWGAKQLFLASLLVVATILAQLRLELRTSLITLGAIAAAIYCFELGAAQTAGAIGNAGRLCRKPARIAGVARLHGAAQHSRPLMVCDQAAHVGSAVGFVSDCRFDLSAHLKPTAKVRLKRAIGRGRRHVLERTQVTIGAQAIVQLEVSFDLAHALVREI